MKGTLFALVCIASALLATAAPSAKEQRTYIVQTANLPNNDKDGNKPLDTSDPFLQIRDSHLNEVFRSETQENTLTPIFVVSIYVDNAEAYYFEVRDEDSFAPDDSLGSVIIPATALVGTHALSNPGGGILTITQLPTAE